MRAPTQQLARQISANAVSLHELGHAHYARGEIELAENAFRRALEIEPKWQRAKTDLGCVLQKRRCYDEAETILRQVLEENPNEYVHHALGLVLWKTKRFHGAETHFREAVRIRPDFFEAENNLGLLLTETNKLLEAEQILRRVLSINALSYQTFNNLGNVLKQLGKTEDAICAYRQALALRPYFAIAKVNLGEALLTIGEYEEGWPLYESRHDAAMGAHFDKPPPVPWPMWNGEPLDGKSLLIWPELGYGDNLQFCRYASMLKARGAAVVSILCPPLLSRLFESLEGVDVVYPMDGKRTIPRHDYWCFIMSLPHRFGTTLETVPASMPYLRAPADLKRAWQARLPKKQFRVGLVWAGNPRPHSAGANSMDKRRSVSLETFMPILRTPNVVFVSLQKGASAQAQIAELTPQIRPLDFMNAVDDFAGTAAIIESLDLVITVDTSVAHVAGALNKPVWILSRYGGCWRWLLDRDDSPWYPSARLFRQTRYGEWGDVIERVTRSLHELIAEVNSSKSAES